MYIPLINPQNEPEKNFSLKPGESTILSRLICVGRLSLRHSRRGKIDQGIRLVIK
jgi:hypothetical protein